MTASKKLETLFEDLRYNRVMKKPDDVKIVSITTKGADIIGVGNDNIIYKYNSVTQLWVTLRD